MFRWLFRRKLTDTVLPEYQANRTMLEAIGLLKRQIESLEHDCDVWRETAERYMRDYVQEVRKQSISAEPDTGAPSFKALRQKLEKQYAEAAMGRDVYDQPRKDSAFRLDQGSDIYPAGDVQ